MTTKCQITSSVTARHRYQKHRGSGDQMQLYEPNLKIREQIDSTMRQISPIEAMQHCPNDRFKSLCLFNTELGEAVLEEL